MNTVAVSPRFEFTLPPELEAGEPPEARGLGRDDVRLMVSHFASGQIQHTQFQELASVLERGDVLVINTSRTRNAALRALRVDCTQLELHLSTHLQGDIWTVEVRAVDGEGKSHHFDGARHGERLTLIAGASATLRGPFVSDCVSGAASGTLWEAELRLPIPADEYLARHAFPIRYNYVKASWPLSYYQTVYATESGSAEMPSAGRPFTLELLAQLRSQGIQVVPLILHTGISNVEAHEPPYQEFYRIPPDTAQAVNDAKQARSRVVAVGTTVVRALESVTSAEGTVHAGEGWTCLVIRPETRLGAVSALLTGLHEPEASHLAILQALAGPDRVQQAYAAALQHRYLWHEFGDLHLLLA
jgi:S-adenosylmethionine:tRNA ribosyltransferase-isomerase